MSINSVWHIFDAKEHSSSSPLNIIIAYVCLDVSVISDFFFLFYFFIYKLLFINIFNEFCESETN